MYRLSRRKRHVVRSDITLIQKQHLLDTVGTLTSFAFCDVTEESLELLLGLKRERSEDEALLQKRRLIQFFGKAGS